MRIRLDALIKPVDPVVAVHPSGRDADADVAALRNAGYGSRMLSVVGQTGPVVDLDSLRPCLSRSTPHWAASGTGLGLSWALFTAAVVVLHPVSGVALVTLVVLMLALQTAVMAQVVAPGRGLLREREPDAWPAPATGDTRSWRFLVLVHGSRSDVALARDILAAR